MLKQAANLNPIHLGEGAVAASRQVWLASLGAAAVTRDWVQTEATRKFKTLVREGTVVESRAVTFVGDQIEGSVNRANRMWRQTRRTVETRVRQAADAAVAFANSALPKSLPKIELPGAAKPAKPAKRAKPATKVARAKKAARKTARKVVRKAKAAAAAAAQA